MKQLIPIFRSPDDFFCGLINEALSKNHLYLDETVKFYLVSLLSYNVGYVKNPYQDVPYAILLHKATLSPVNERRGILKFVGDTSLYTVGYFNDSLNKKIVSRDYYINVGEQAFRHLSNISPSKHVADLYWGIFKSFNYMVEVLEEVSLQTFSFTQEDFIRLYKKWQSTKKLSVEVKLRELGIVTGIKKDKS